MSGQTNGLPPLEVLLPAIRAGDEQAIDTFMKHFEPKLRRSKRIRGKLRLLHGLMDSEDLAQSAFRRAIQAIQSEEGVKFENEGKLGSYLKTLGINWLLDQLRRQKTGARDRQRTISGEAAGLASLPGKTHSPSEEAERKEEQEERKKLIADLENNYPWVMTVLRRREEGVSWDDLARDYEYTSVDALRKQVYRDLEEIREAQAAKTQCK